MQIHKTIYLQICDEGGNLSPDDDYSWCSERIHATDLEYRLVGEPYPHCTDFLAVEEDSADRWRNVPAAAQAIAMDADGKWYWYAAPPHIDGKIAWESAKGSRYGCILPQPRPVPNWKHSMELRPCD
jgi:hypothetical protein